MGVRESEIERYQGLSCSGCSIEDILLHSSWKELLDGLDDERDD